MSVWAFGDILFDDYSVYVSGHSSILDIPELTDEGHDWLDQDERSYWLTYDKLKKSDRNIVLNCWIKADNYSDFKTNTLGFLQAIAAEGEETLVTPYGNITSVALNEAVNVIRETSYVASQQVGTFSITLTVLGDGSFVEYMTVYTDAGIPASAALYYDNSLKLVKRLQGEAYVSVTVEKNTLASIYHREYYILLPVVGTNVEKFYLDKEPEIQKKSTNKFIINYRFEQECFRMKYISFLSDLTSEADFYYYADLEEIIDLIVWNCDRYSSGWVYKGTPFTVTTDKRNHKFSGDNCYSVLQRICEEYEVEYWLDYNAGSWGINIAEQITRVYPFSMSYGKNNGFWDITRESINTEELCNVLYAFGANKNLKYDYGYSRLVCPGNPLTDATSISLYGRHEQVKFFDYIYPAFTGTVIAYDQILTTDVLYDTIKEVWPGGMYRITHDTNLTWDIDENSLGMPSKIWMTSGNLKGYQFEVEKHDLANRYIFIRPMVDEHAGSYPSATVYINQSGTDTFTLIDTKQDASYETTALATLLSDAGDWLTNHVTSKITYHATVDPAFMYYIAQHYPTQVGIQIGDTIPITDSDLSMSGNYRVSELTYTYETKQYDITLSESKPLTKREKQQIQIDNIQKVIDSSKINTPDGTKKSNETTGELLNRIFLTSDYKLNVDNIVRNESIDPRMLAYDSGVPQFFLDGCIVEPNYNNDPNSIKVGSGSVTITNWSDYTENRYEIDKLISNAEEYNPMRTWFITDDYTYTFSNNLLQYLYVVIPLDAGISEATFEFNPDHIEVKRYISEGLLYYKLGYITPASSPRQAAMLWGNIKIPDYYDFLKKLTGESEYGYLYNEYAVTDLKGIAGSGWRIPTISDIATLVTRCSGSDEAGYHLKSNGTTYWEDGGESTGVDTYKFDARGSGTRSDIGDFSDLLQLSYMATDTTAVFKLVYDDIVTTNIVVADNVGRSIRLIKDTTTLYDEGQTSWYQGNDGKLYKTIMIGEQEWMAENLAETRYSDGTLIPNVTDNTAWGALTTGAYCTYNNDATKGFMDGLLNDFVESVSSAINDNYVDNVAYSAESSGTLPTVTNTNNVVRLTLSRTNSLPDLTADLGSMAGYKYWEGSQAEYDALSAWDNDTLYFVTE